MNCAQRRTTQRRITKALREGGCTCGFRIVPDADGNGGEHVHQRGCPLDAALTLRAIVGRRLELLVIDPRCTTRRGGTP